MSVPKLRFPEFNNNWDFGVLSNLIKSLDAGVSVNSSNECPIEGQHAILKTSCVSFGYFEAKERKAVVEPREISRLKELLLDDSILISRMNTPLLVGANAYITFAPQNTFVPDRLWQVKVYSDLCNVRWLSYILSSDKGRDMLRVSASGTSNSMKNITKSDVLQIPVYIATLEEQTKIANFLTAVDDRITQLAQKCDLLNRYKKGVMQQIFNQKLRFKDENGKVFPHWVRCSLDALGETYNGLTGKSAGDFGEGYPYVTYKQIFDNRVINQENFSLVKIDENEKQNSIKYGDLFFTTSSETAEEVAFCSVFLERQQREIYLNSFCFGFRPKDARTFNSIFASFLFRSDYFREKVSPLAQGSTRFNISKSKFIKLKVEIPCIQEQTKIANFLAAIDDKIAQADSELEAVREYKRGLLQQMFV